MPSKPVSFAAPSAFVITAATEAAWRRYSMSREVRSKVAGTGIAPSRMRASIVVHHSGTRGSMSNTRSPGLMPAAARKLAV